MPLQVPKPNPFSTAGDVLVATFVAATAATTTAASTAATTAAITAANSADPPRHTIGQVTGGVLCPPSEDEQVEPRPAAEDRHQQYNRPPHESATTPERSSHVETAAENIAAARLNTSGFSSGGGDDGGGGGSGGGGEGEGGGSCEVGGESPQATPAGDSANHVVGGAPPRGCPIGRELSKPGGVIGQPVEGGGGRASRGGGSTPAEDGKGEGEREGAKRVGGKGAGTESGEGGGKRDEVGGDEGKEEDDGDGEADGAPLRRRLFSRKQAGGTGSSVAGGQAEPAPWEKHTRGVGSRILMVGKREERSRAMSMLFLRRCCWYCKPYCVGGRGRGWRSRERGRSRKPRKH